MTTRSSSSPAPPGTSAPPQVKDQAIANNRAVNWVPEHIKEGRFGDFLANNVDWALSRERYWGTPLPLWIHSETGEVEAVALAPGPAREARQQPRRRRGRAQGLRRPEARRHHRRAPHRPQAVDRQGHVREARHPGPLSAAYPRSSTCWFDSGCMPFAQWGFPHAPGSREKFTQAFPADFISEAIDQTRGWFYSLLMIRTLVFDEETQKREGICSDPRLAAPVQELHRARPRLRQGGQEGVQVQGQLHPAGDHPRRSAHGLRRAG